MSKSNILFICTDQHRQDTLGCYGNEVCKTPNLNGLASEGCSFDCAFTPTAICTAARASVLTGLMPHRHGLLANFERNVGYPTELDEKHIHFSRYLRDVGYHCANVGKWHIGVVNGPDHYGFDGPHFPGWDAPVQHPVYLQYLEENGLSPFRVRDEIRGRFPNGHAGNVMGGVYEGPVEGTYPYFLAGLTIQRLEGYARTQQPFFLWLNFFGPHLPYYIPEHYADVYDPNSIELPDTLSERFDGKPIVQGHYAALWAVDTLGEEELRKLIAMNFGYVTLIDEQVGRVLSALDELALSPKTAVFFSADHGAFVGAHRMMDKGPAMYDDIYRVPLLTRWSGHTSAGSACHELVSLVDLPATFLDIAGLQTPEHFDGRSIVPLLEGRTPTDWPKEIFAEFHGHHFPYPQRMVRTRLHKLIVNPPDVNELYDLVNDPQELCNRIDDLAYSDVKRELMIDLYRKLRASGDNFYHWMSSMFDVGESVGNAALSQYQRDHTDDRC